MKQPAMVKATALALALFFVFPFHASAGNLVIAGAGQPLHTYYDGGQQRQILLDDALVAEFAGKTGTAGGVAKSVIAGAQVEKNKGGATIYRLTGVSAKSALRSASLAAASPVFHEGGTPAGRLMALPGGLLVNFKPGWSEQHVNDWAAGKGLVVDKRLAIGENWYVIKSSPGQASLDLANRIHLSGEVVSATPNWWMEVFIQ